MNDKLGASRLGPVGLGSALVGSLLFLNGDTAEDTLPSWQDDEQPPSLGPVARRIVLPAPEFGADDNAAKDGDRKTTAAANLRSPVSAGSVALNNVPPKAQLQSTASENALASSQARPGLTIQPRIAIPPQSSPIAAVGDKPEQSDQTSRLAPHPALISTETSTPPPVAKLAAAKQAKEQLVEPAFGKLDSATAIASGTIELADSDNSDIVQPPVAVADSPLDPMVEARRTEGFPTAISPQPSHVDEETVSPTSAPTALADATTANPATPLISRSIPGRGTSGETASASTDEPSLPRTVTAAPPPSAPLSVPTTAPAPTPAPPPVAPQTDAGTTSYASLIAAPTVSAAPAPPLPPQPAVSSSISPPEKLLQTQGRTTFPVSGSAPSFSYDDELILEITVEGARGTDTIIAYGTREGTYLPLGTLARILDLAITVSDDGNYASGWFLDEKRTLTLDLRQNRATLEGETSDLEPADATAFEGDLFLRAEKFSDFLPLVVTPNLRNQSVNIDTLEPFPFQERMRREAQRARLGSRDNANTNKRWPREDTAYLPLSVPMADVELRAASGDAEGTRLEGDLRLAGDFAYLTAQAYLSATSKDGLVSSFIELGRRDPDADLLGPLKATEFEVGDVGTTSMPIGLRGVTGRGFAVTNTPLENVSVFDQIDLRGQLPDGYEVELYRNDILINSTDSAINGQFEFLQVPVDFGLNVFRLVYYGPQGQRREEVRRISVGDGRLSKGQFHYQLGAAQNGVNLLGVRGPNFFEPENFGKWRAGAQFAYGLSAGLTTTFGGAWFDTDQGERWITNAGIRTSLGGLAVKGDLALADEGAKAFGLGIGGKLFGSGFTLSHTEYDGPFVDETLGFGSDFVRRATEGAFNTTLSFGGEIGGRAIPLSSRFRRVEFRDGRSQSNAALRASTRFPGALLSNTLEYTRSDAPNISALSQLFGNFDLATFSRKATQLRGSLSYQLVPDVDLVSVSGEVDHQLDDRTVIRGSAGYAFRSKDVQIGASAIREFDKFTLALDGSYGFAENNYAVVLRLGFSFGRDPFSGRFLLDRPGQASSGSIALRAFQDLDGDNAYGPGDTLLPDVQFAAFNQTATTDADGTVRLNQLGSGTRVSVQVDPSTLPDILMAPKTRGIEIVPRPGRTHQTDFAIVGLSELDGTVFFRDQGKSRGVSGVRLKLVPVAGEDAEDNTKYVRTETDGYFFFEQLMPGEYLVTLDPGQAERLDLCLVAAEPIVIDPVGSTQNRDFIVERCED